MHPVIFKVGSFIFYTYGFFVFLAFLVEIFFFLRQAKKKNLPEQRILNFAFWLVIFGMVGARILYVIIEFFRADYPKAFLHLTTPQLISMGLGIFSIMAIKNIRKISKGDYSDFAGKSQIGN